MSTTPATLPLRMWLGSKVWRTAMGFIVKKDGSFNRRLADMVDRKVSASETPVNGVRSRDVTIDDDTKLWVRIFSPADSAAAGAAAGTLPLIFYIHGGFFAFLSAASKGFDGICRKLCKECNAVVISVDYRRIPEHRYPCAIEDCFRAVEWSQSAAAAAHLPSRADASKSFIVGDSAGGNLAHFTACKVAEAAAAGVGVMNLRGMVLVQPSFSGPEETEAEARFGLGCFADSRVSAWRWKAYLPEGASKDHPACNVSGPSSAGLISPLLLPPSMVVIGGYCPAQEWQRRYVQAMECAGKQVDVKFYEEAVHGFYLFPDYNLTLQLHEDVTGFIQRHCN